MAFDVTCKSLALFLSWNIIHAMERGKIIHYAYGASSSWLWPGLVAHVGYTSKPGLREAHKMANFCPLLAGKWASNSRIFLLLIALLSFGKLHNCTLFVLCPFQWFCKMRPETGDSWESAFLTQSQKPSGPASPQSPVGYHERPAFPRPCTHSGLFCHFPEHEKCSATNIRLKICNCHQAPSSVEVLCWHQLFTQQNHVASTSKCAKIQLTTKEVSSFFKVSETLSPHFGH